MNPFANWYWLVGDDATRVWSSAAAAYLSTSDPGYQDWLAAGGRPAPVANEAVLAAALRANFPPGLGALAALQPPPSAAIWQLKAICDSAPASLDFTPPTWAQITAAAASLSSPALSDFIAASAPQPIPEDSTTIAAMNAALPTPMTATQLLAFFTAAAQVTIP